MIYLPGQSGFFDDIFHSFKKAVSFLIQLYIIVRIAV